MNTSRKHERLILNLSPVHFDDAEVPVGIIDCDEHDENQLRKLRADYSASHVFLRDGPHIWSVPFVSAADTIGDRFETIQLKDHFQLCAALVRNALLNRLYQLERPVYGYRPLRFAATGPKNNLLALSLPPPLDCPDWLSIHPFYMADVRVFHLDGQPPLVGIAFDVRTHRRISLSCKELLERNFSPVNLYVGRTVANPDPRIAPHLELLGRVNNIDGEFLLLTDARPDLSSIDAADAVLEPRWDAFDRCLRHLFGDQIDQIQAALNREVTSIRTGPTRLEKLSAAVQYLGKTPLEMVPGVPATIMPLLSSDSHTAFPPLRTAPKPVYVFDATGTRTDTWHDRGLNDYGPYSAQTFDKNRPRICVVCQANKRGQVEQFLHKLFHGLNLPGKRRAPFQKGFIRKYALEDVATEFFTAADDTAAAYRRAVERAIVHQEDRNDRWDLALVQIEDRFHSLHGEENPYFLTKLLFLAQQIPTQEFEIETTALPDSQLGYVLNNMSLATYAKLGGGIPWLIKSDPTIAHELVIGLGSASVGEGRLGERERVVGITTVFSGDGNYWLSNLTRCVPIAEYREALLDSLRRTVTKVRQDMNWQPRDHVRLVFHAAFKPFKDTEAQAVKALMAELGDYDVDYAFLHVVQNHPYVLFDQNQSGAFDFETRGRKGVFAPNRGGYLRLSGHEVLLVLTGPKNVKRPEDGLPRPVLLRLHRESSFKDTTYLARQAYIFACHSWRSFFPASLPVTILYSELIARLLGQLGTISWWNPDLMVGLGRIGRTRWFL
jgi:hypothetical protein